MTDTRLNLIKSANSLRNNRVRTDTTVRYNLSVLAETQASTPEALSENVTHLLANLASAASAGSPLKLMHLNSIAAFLAGVESIANALPNAQDQTRVEKTLRVLQAAAVGADGFINSAVTPIAQLGARKTELMSKYDQMVKDYMLGVSRGQPDGAQLSQAAKQLQTMIDQAMNAAKTNTQANSPATPRPEASGTVPPTV